MCLPQPTTWYRNTRFVGLEFENSAPQNGHILWSHACVIWSASCAAILFKLCLFCFVGPVLLLKCDIPYRIVVVVA
uniref:Uncharacterized protein n=1 Tax=Anguilla anguilla TaxID=7936 RepID=A0A0E9XST1_ANGAN